MYTSNGNLPHFILINFLMQIATISKGLSFLYVKGSKVKHSKL